jgi:hypothetical protein
MWTHGMRDVVFFLLGWFAGAFVAWQVWIYHVQTLRQIKGHKRRRDVAVGRAARCKDASRATDGRKHWECN